jgi:TonB family protein
MTDSVGIRKEEGDVDRFLKQNNRKDIVLARCLEASKCKSTEVRMADGSVVKGDVTAGKIVNKPQPRYPAIAKAARQSGTVLVAVIVNEEGNVIAAQVQSGPPLLRVAALDAARAVLFTPSLLDGKPVK